MARRWHGGGTVENLGLPFGQSVNVHGVSPSGVVVGAALDPGFSPSAVRYRDGRWERLPKQGASSWAHDVNKVGDVVGADDGNGGERLVIWPDGDFGAPRYLPLPDKATRLDPTPAIDDDGTVVGTYGLTVGNTLSPHGWVWRPGASVPTQLGPIAKDGWETVADIHDGHIVGAARGSDGSVTGVEWDASGKIVRKFPGKPVAVNRMGFVVGQETDGDWSVWMPDGSTEPTVLPAGYSQMWPAAFGEGEVGGDLVKGGTSVPTAWHRFC